MDFRDEHLFDAPLDVVWDMFSDPDSHTTKFESMGHRDIAVLESDFSDGAFHLKVSRVVDLDLPGFAKRVMKPTNTVVTTDDWSRQTDGSYKGRQIIETQGSPVKISSDTLLVTEGDQTRYIIDIHLEVKVPLIGGKLADWAKGTVRTQLDHEFTCGDEWLAATA